MNYKWEFLRRNRDFLRDVEDLRGICAEREELVAKFNEDRCAIRSRLEKNTDRQVGPRELLAAESEVRPEFYRKYEDILSKIREMSKMLRRRWGIWKTGGEGIIAEGEESFGKAALILPRPRGSSTGISAEDLRADLLMAADSVADLARLACPHRMGPDAVDLLEVLEEGEDPFSDRSDVGPLLREWFNLYQVDRTEFFWGSYPDPYEEPANSLGTWLDDVKMFLQARELNRWACVQVDTSRSKREILAEVGKIVDILREIRRIEGIRVPVQRQHLAKYDDYLRVWDLRESKHTFEQTAKIMYPGDYSDPVSRQTAIDRVKKQFGAAYKHIYGKDYVARPRRAVKKTDLRKSCDTCAARESCTELCPEVLYYIEQGQRGSSRELLVEDLDVAEKTFLERRVGKTKSSKNTSGDAGPR
jgi:hypothetical protein